MAQSEPLCVYCRRRPVNPATLPFCSERCRLADLGRWLSGDYRVPGETPEEDATTPVPADPGEDRGDE